MKKRYFAKYNKELAVYEMFCEDDLIFSNLPTYAVACAIAELADAGFLLLNQEEELCIVPPPEDVTFPSLDKQLYMLYGQDGVVLNFEQPEEDTVANLPMMPPPSEAKES
jgi:hypothetical protein